MTEEWRDVCGYEGRYQISNLGRIKSLRDRTVIREKILKPQPDGHGYMNIVLSNGENTKRYFIHRLVASAFIENPNSYEFVNHKDENPRNNSVENLEWCTRSYNTLYYLNMDPSRKIKMANNFRDKSTGGSLSSYTKKNVAHANTRAVVQKDKNGNVVGVYENAADACGKTGILYTKITNACRKNESGIPKKKKKGCDRFMAHGYVWEYI